jgi:phenylalanine-4-hydroxylase
MGARDRTRPTVEFGVAVEDGELRAYGAGILAS